MRCRRMPKAPLLTPLPALPQRRLVPFSVPARARVRDATMTHLDQAGDSLYVPSNTLMCTAADTLDPGVRNENGGG